jgi:hypothetical protein
MNYTAVAKGLLIDDATLRTWHRLYQEQGIEGLASFGYEGSACRLSEQQQDKLTAWITETLPRSTRDRCLDRAGMRHRIPGPLRSDRAAAPARHGASQAKSGVAQARSRETGGVIKAYEDLLNHMGDDEAVLFGDAMHPTQAVQRFGQPG